MTHSVKLVQSKCLSCDINFFCRILTPIIRCLYTGEIEINTGDVIDYYHASKILELPNLQFAIALAIKKRYVFSVYHSFTSIDLWA